MGAGRRSRSPGQASPSRRGAPPSAKDQLEAERAKIRLKLSQCTAELIDVVCT